MISYNIKSETTLNTVQRWHMGPSNFWGFPVPKLYTVHNSLEAIAPIYSNGDYSCILIAKLSMTL